MWLWKNNDDIGNFLIPAYVLTFSLIFKKKSHTKKHSDFHKSTFRVNSLDNWQLKNLNACHHHWMHNLEERINLKFMFIWDSLIYCSKKKVSLHKMQSLTQASNKQTIISLERWMRKLLAQSLIQNITSIKLLGNGNVEETIAP